MTSPGDIHRPYRSSNTCLTLLFDDVTHHLVCLTLLFDDVIQQNRPNTDIGRVYTSPAHPTPANLPPHRYVMATEGGRTWAVNNNEDGVR
jgi:hypothetical protein